MGISTFLYFETAKDLGILLLVMSLVYSIYALVTNIIASGIDVTQNPTTLTNNLNVLSLITKISSDAKVKDTNETYYEIQCWIGLALVIIWCLMLFVLKYF